MLGASGGSCNSACTQQGLTCHLARSHGYKHPVSLRLDSAVCPCNKDNTVGYLNIKHVRDTKICHKYVMNMPILSKDRLAELLKIDNALINDNLRKGLPKFSAHRREWGGVWISGFCYPPCGSCVWLFFNLHCHFFIWFSHRAIFFLIVQYCQNDFCQFFFSYVGWLVPFFVFVIFWRYVFLVRIAP